MGKREWSSGRETFETAGYQRIFYLVNDDPEVINSTIGVVPDSSTTTPNAENKTNISPIFSTLPVNNKKEIKCR